MDLKIQFLSDYLRTTLAFSELCNHFGISRKTGYKRVDRNLHRGPATLEDRSRKPRTSPNQTPPPVVNALLELLRLHPSLGAKKLLIILGNKRPTWNLPNRSTVCEIL